MIPEMTIDDSHAVPITPGEGREIDALHDTHIRDIRHATNVGANATLLLTKVATNAIYDRDYIACIAAHKTCSAVIEACDETSPTGFAHHVAGLANVLSLASERIHLERGGHG